MANIEMKNLVISSEQIPTEILFRQQTQVDHNKFEAKKTDAQLRIFCL